MDLHVADDSLDSFFTEQDSYICALINLNPNKACGIESIHPILLNIVLTLLLYLLNY